MGIEGGHVWNSQMATPSRRIIKDWCVICGEDKELQGLSSGQQETCPEPRPEVRDSLADGSEAA